MTDAADAPASRRIPCVGLLVYLQCGACRCRSPLHGGHRDRSRSLHAPRPSLLPDARLDCEPPLTGRANRRRRFALRSVVTPSVIDSDWSFIIGLTYSAGTRTGLPVALDVLWGASSTECPASVGVISPGRPGRPLACIAPPSASRATITRLDASAPISVSNASAVRNSTSGPSIFLTSSSG